VPNSALYFANAPGFGQWRLLISGRADRDLRQFRSRDANMYKIIIKKLMCVQLSPTFMTAPNPDLFK